MNKKEFNKQKRRVEGFIKKWSVPLWLGWWHIDYLWYDSDEEYDKDRPLIIVDQNGPRRGLMYCNARWEYNRATIGVNLPCASTQTDDELEEAVVHEFCHILVNETREEDENWRHEERVVSTLARAFMTVRKWGDKDV